MYFRYFKKCLWLFDFYRLPQSNQLFHPICHLLHRFTQAFGSEDVNFIHRIGVSMGWPACRTLANGQAFGHDRTFAGNLAMAALVRSLVASDQNNLVMKFHD